MEFNYGNTKPNFTDAIADIDASSARMNYKGPERRQTERRHHVNRRNKLRFEPGKCIDRREQSDRRKHNNPV